MIDAELESCFNSLYYLQSGSNDELQYTLEKPELRDVIKFSQSNEVLSSWLPGYMNVRKYDDEIINKGMQIESHEAKAFALKELVYEWKVINDWYDKVKKDPLLYFRTENGQIKGIEFQSIDFFGPSIGIGFIKFISYFINKDAIVHLKKKHDIPGIVFMRSPAVAVLPVITVENEPLKYTLVVIQARVAAGIARFMEIPAGMMDDSSNFGGQIAKEMKEETGFIIHEKEMICLTDWAYEGKDHEGMYPSVGGCNEFLKLYLWETTVSGKKFAELIGNTNDRVFGNKTEGECIRIKIIPLENLAKEAPDGKALSALALYDRYVKHNKTINHVTIDMSILKLIRNISMFTDTSKDISKGFTSQDYIDLTTNIAWSDIKSYIIDNSITIEGLTEIEKKRVRSAILKMSA